MPTGAVTEILVLDLDPRNGGPADRDELIEQFGPIPNTAEVITGGGGRHLYFRYSGGSVPKTIGPGLDLKGCGGYVMLPPAVHPSGKRYKWDGIEGVKALLKPAEAPEWLLARILRSRTPSTPRSPAELPQVIPDGQKHDTIVSLAGTLRRRGVSEEAAFAACRALKFQSPVTDEDIRERVRDVFQKYPCATQIAGRMAAASYWPKPEPIQSELPPVEAFSEDLLPDSFRPLVADVTERMQVPMDYPAAVMVLCLAGAVNRRVVIQPKASDTAWVVVPNLWGGIIAPPGFMKSPCIQAATRPLNQIQTGWRREYEEALKDYAREQEEHELRRAAWKEQYKAASKKGNAAPDRPEGEPEEPKLRRLIVNDATFEALHQTMSENPAGILVIRDELTGWWSQLDRAGREGERAFCLQAWNGDTGHTIDRIGRGTIHVEACCMSMLGGIQPSRLRSYLVDALEDGPSNDGLIQRFQVLVWPDTAPDWNYVDRAPDSASEERAARVFRKLVEVDAEDPACFRFDSDAQELFIEWYAELERKIRGDELHPALISHLSKYRSLMPSLALLFHLSEMAAGNGDADAVSLNSTRRAAAWCEYLESHARRVYSCIVTPQLRAARELAEKIRRRKVGADGFFSCRDVYLKGWSGLDSPEAVKQAAEVLQDSGWVRDLSIESGPFGGRPSNRYEVNPGVRE
jgi:putative DNA primase/helicase